MSQKNKLWEKYLIDSTVVFVIDMVNGFVNEGNLASPRIKKIVPKMQFFLKLCQQKNIARYAVNDAHTSSSLEFNSYPSHCLFGSDESNLISELLTYDLTIINKNSTNAFFMLQGLDFWNNKSINKIIVIGCCTDICVYQLAITLKTYFNEFNRKMEIIVIADLTETYEDPENTADLRKKIFLTSLKTNGIIVI